MSKIIWEIVSTFLGIFVIAYIIINVLRVIYIYNQDKREKKEIKAQLAKLYELFYNGDDEMKPFYNDLHEMVMVSVGRDLSREEFKNISENYNFYLNIIYKIRGREPIETEDMLTFSELHMFYTGFVERYRYQYDNDSVERFIPLDLENVEFVAGLN